MPRGALNEKLRRWFIVALLYCIFTAGCLVTPFLVLAFPFSGRESYVRRVVRAADRLIAAMLGFSGRYTLSAEVTFSRQRYHRKLHDALNEVVPNHCEHEVYEEGVYCKLYDHEKRLHSEHLGEK